MRTKQLQCFLTAVLVLLLFSFAAQGKGRPFITRWKGEAGKELYIPIQGENYKLVIKKADGTVLKTETSLTGLYRYIPTKSGELIVEAGPEGVRSFSCWYGRAEALLRVEQFGTVQWQTMQNAFYGCKNMQFASGIDTPDLSKVTNMSNMFSGCTSFNQPLNSWDVSKVTSMGSMFYGCTSFNQPLNSWDVSKVTFMSRMFSGCTSFNQPLNSWDVSKVTYMSRMFSGCTSFNQPLNSWDVSKVTDMIEMFSDCTSFNQPLNNWNVSKVTDMRAMFDGCASFNQPLNNWNVSQVTDMAYMFSYCSSFNQNLGMWKLEKCEDLDLDNCGMSEENYSKSLVGWASQANIKQGLYLSARGLKYNASGKAALKKLIESKKWSISDVVDENDRPFITRWKGEAGKELYIPIKGENYKLVIKKADGTVLKTETSLTITDYGFYKYTPSQDGELIVEAGPEGVTSFSCMFVKSAGALLRVEQFGTVQWQTMRGAFSGCGNMQFAPRIDTPDLSKVIDMSYMFSGCTLFNYPLNRWNVNKVTYMSYMFSGCTFFNQPLNNWDVSKVTNMEHVFTSCTSFNQPLDNWDLSKVTDMSYMFFSCTSFNQPLNNWDVSKVDNMSNMFSGCTSFNQPLNSWDVSKVTFMTKMFSGCTSFNQDLGMWRLEQCRALELGNCGMSAENYSKSLLGWAAQSDINERLRLDASRLEYFPEATESRKKLINNKSWSIIGDRLLPYYISFKTRTLTLTKGEEHTLVLTKKGFDASETVVLTSSDPYTVQIIDAASLTIKGLKAGKATITATVAGNWNHWPMKTTCEVFVTVPVTGVTLSQTKLPLLRGATAKLTATVSPTGATNRKITWSSNNTTVATVENGTVTAVSAGNAIITVTTEDGNHTARCEVVVTDPIPVSGVTLSQTKLPLLKGATAKLTATVSPADATNKKVRWSSNNTAVAIVENGTVTAVSAGNATITVTTEDGNYTARCVVVVTDPIPVTGVTLSQTELLLVKGAIVTLAAAVVPSDATNQKVTWSSNNTAVAIVENGTVTAVSGGAATITVTTEDGNHTATCEITVTVPITGVTLPQTELSLVKGATAGLTATVSPSDATNQKVTWSSTNTAVATVENGTVTAVSAGNATITVTTEDGNHTARCEVTVTVSATGVTLSQTELPLAKGTTATLTATVVPFDATNQKVTWNSNNTAVATVENGTVAALSVGNATITVTTEDGNHTATCEVTVTVPVTGVTLSQTELSLVKGATAPLTATVVPSDATNQKVRWSSNNTSVATVENGTVTAVSGGNATITVTTEEGNHTARCEVTVTVSATGVTLSQTELPLAKGATATLTATVAPSDATNQKVSWSSNNTAVAIVENGTVTAVSAGNATITVTTEDGNHAATCSVTVEATSAVEDAVFASVVVSPNPFGEQLCITYGDLRGQYVLYNAQGVVVASGGLEDGETRINTASFTAGVYLLRLIAENGATKNYTVVKD